MKNMKDEDSENKNEENSEAVIDEEQLNSEEKQ